MSTEPASPDPTGRITTTAYDSAGRPVRVGDPPGVVTTTAYSGCSPTDTVPSGNITWVCFDAQGNVIDRGTGMLPAPDNTPTPDPGDTPPDEPHIVG